MFTGIITDVGRVNRLEALGDTRVSIATGFDVDGIDMGASVACAGCCLTVVAKQPGELSFDVSAETLSKTTLGAWQEGTRVNLERALKVGDELGGHLVSGHVDGAGRLAARRAEGDSWRLTFDVPDDLARFIAPKGSIAIDGVSLTVNEVTLSEAGGTQFGVNIIPHTWEATTLGDLADGAAVNLEIDMLARYVARLLDTDG